MTIYERPWRLQPHRVHRFYRGGRLLDTFRGVPARDARDSNEPEDWVGSATRAWTRPGTPAAEEGLASAEIAGETRRIADLLRADPDAVAGADLVNRVGPTTGLLVKLLDAGVRLPVHLHPTRAFAGRHLDSPFGKAEAWIILATRTPDATVRIGFRRDVGRDDLVRLIREQQTDELLDAMHEQATRPGDVWFIPPGVPHAIGAGIFMVEVEEPTDFSIVIETRAVPIDPADAHLRLGWDVAIDAIDRSGHDEAWLEGLRSRPREIALPSRDSIERRIFERIPLTGDEAAPYFRAERLAVVGSAGGLYDRPAYLVGIVTAGSGVVRTRGGELTVRSGETFAVPAAAIRSLEIESTDHLEVVACLPPEPEVFDGVLDHA